MTFIIILFIWAVATVFCALLVARRADDLAESLRRRNKRKHSLGRWLKFHGGVK
jgi:hypothetical protein